MANPSTRACPNLSQYQQLLSGTLPDAEKEPLLSHLEGCDACARQLKSLPEPDTLVGLLRQADTLSEEASRKAIAGLVERLSKMRPQSAEATNVPATGAPNLDATIDQKPIEAAKKSTYDFLAPALAPDEIGRLGPYRVLEVLGSGGMGVVFRAEDPQLARLVALKAMLPGFIASDNARQRFLREAKSAAGIKHDNIVSIYQVGEDRGILFLAMEFLEGEPLDKRLDREGKLPVAEVLRIGKQVATALAAAHKRGMIHRDIKPANIWLEAETNRVKILDFGLARTSGENAQLTQQGAIVGTPAYMSPEQGKGKPVDHRCDLFSLGCVLYRLATGAPAFHGTDVVSTLVSVATETPRPPQVLEPRLPRALSDLIVQLLAKDAAQRPASAQVVAERLEAIAEEQARVVPKKPRRRWPVVAGAAACLAFLFAGIVFYMQTPDGVVRIEIDDPEIKLAIEGHQAIITKAETKPITLKPGKQGLTITRGDFVFNSNAFEMPGRGGKTALKITWHQGKKLTIAQDGRPLAVNVVREPAPVDPERLAAEYVLALHGTVKVDALSNPFLYIVAELPRRPFQVSLIELRNLQITDSGLANLKPCKNVRRLFLFGTPITDVGLAQLRHFTTLEHLHLGSTRVTDTGLAYFKNCKGLTDLDIVYTAIGDDGLAHLKDFGSLTALNLIGTRVSDAGLDHLKHCASLRVVHLQKTKVTESGARKLAAALPRCRIEWNGPVIEPSTVYTNSLGMEFARVPAGKAWLGGGAGKPGNKKVEFKDDFYLGVYEVTQEEWEKVTGKNPSHFSRNGPGKNRVADISDDDLKRFPVESVSWDDARLFLELLNKRVSESGWVYRLSTPAEWEYACRGGPLSNVLDSIYDFYLEKPTHELLLEQANFAPAKADGLKRPCKVGSYKPNRLGLYDMHGNVGEWCEEAYTDKAGALRGHFRPGSWSQNADRSRAAQSYGNPPRFRVYDLGLRVARVRSNRFTNALGMDFALVPRGKSWLGGGAGKQGTKEVEFKDDFYLGVYEVTQEQWQQLMGNNPSLLTRSGGGKDALKTVSDDDLKKFPVEFISWHDAQRFIAELNKRDHQPGWTYRLPTETEWEYACRGGPMTDKAESAFDFYLATPTNQLSPKENSYGGGRGLGLQRATKVGSYAPNKLGLHDMHGNVVEWCDDEFPADPKGPPRRVIRGGHFWGDAADCRAAYRFVHDATFRNPSMGMRVARVRVAPVEQRYLTNAIGMKLAKVPKGKSWLGGRGGQPGSLEVEIKDDFYLGAYEVTQEEWDKVLGVNPSHYARAGAGANAVKDVTDADLKRFPVENISWEEIQIFLKKLNELDATPGWTYRLPTNIEWEYACRGGPMTDRLKTAFDAYFDKPTNNLLPEQANFKHKGAPMRPVKVGSFPANPLGLHDMIGNVWEWAADEVVDPGRPPGHRLVGGFFGDDQEYCRAAGIGWGGAGHRAHAVGFRVARVRAEPDRRAAESLLSLPREHAIAVQVNDVDRWINKARDLPAEPFRLTAVWAEWVSSLDDNGLSSFAGCKHLKVLRLWGTQTSAQGLVHFKDCQELQEISLNGDNFNDDAVALFKDRKHLTTFHVISKNVTDVGVTNFQWTKDLTTLTLTHTKVTDVGLASFKDNKSLKVLNLGATKATNAGLAPFAGCKDLEALELFWTNIGDAGLTHFKDCKKLTRLNLDRLFKVTDKGIGIFKDADDLRVLNVGGTRITNDGLAQVKSWPKLKILQLPNTQITDMGLAHLKACRNLEELSLLKTRVNGSGVVHLQDCPKLVRLTLRETETDDKSVPAFGELTKLRWLAVERTRLSAEGVKKLSAALPQCEIVSDHGVFRPGQKAK